MSGDDEDRFQSCRHRSLDGVDNEWLTLDPGELLRPAEPLGTTCSQDEPGGGGIQAHHSRQPLTHGIEYAEAKRCLGLPAQTT